MAGGSGAGSSAEKLNSPWGVYVDSSNTLFVVDRSNHRIQKWTIGKYKTKIKKSNFVFF